MNPDLYRIMHLGITTDPEEGDIATWVAQQLEVISDTLAQFGAVSSQHFLKALADVLVTHQGSLR